MKSRADADTFVVSMAGNREHCISLSFHGPSWSGIRIKTLCIAAREMVIICSLSSALPLGFLPS